MERNRAWHQSLSEGYKWEPCRREQTLIFRPKRKDMMKRTLSLTARERRISYHLPHVLFQQRLYLTTVE